MPNSPRVTLQPDGPAPEPEHNWGIKYRWFLTAISGSLVLNATFASSAPANLEPDFIEHFHVSEEVGVLTISMYMLGPLLWGPLSEQYGRRIIFLVAFFPYMCFQIGCALWDMWDANHLGDAMAIFSLMPILGPAIAPIFFLIPETYLPYILKMEAKRLRKETGDDRWHSAMDKREKETIPDILRRTILKPIIMLVQEPMLFIMSLYMSFVYGVIYLAFEAIPIIFIGQHGLNSGEAGMVFISMAVGSCLAVFSYIVYFNPQYSALHAKLAPKSVPPEVRLRSMMIGGPALAISLFWLAWTSYPHISIWSPILAICLLGSSTFYIFMGCLSYIIDTYLMNAASALSINTVMRSGFGAGFPLFANQMYATLGTPGATSLLAGLAVVFIPAPFLLIKYGKKMRGLSKNAVVRQNE
ncbi:hypothetical protein RQP46_005674 [Phenoliferia psychrophenolica]